jgi:PAS domain S-box-containing protein
VSGDQARAPWPAHKGEIARLLRERDWAATPIGPSRLWPAPLRFAIDLMLPSPAAISVSWANPATFFYNDAFMAIAGHKHPAVFGGSAQRDWPEVAAFTASVLRQVEAGESVMLRGQPLDILRSGVTEHGSFDIAFSPINDESGRQAGLMVIVNETTELMRAQAELRATEARFRQFADAASEVLWIRDAQTLALEYVGPSFERIWGAPINEFLQGAEPDLWVALVEPDYRPALLSTFDRVRAGQRVTHEFPIRRPDTGERRWIGGVAFPVLDAQGRVQRIGGISSDITQARQARERNDVLVAELQHRSRNLLAVVTAVANRTLGRGGSVESFEARLMALGRAQGLLSRQGAETVDVGALIRAELEIHAETRPPKVTLSGPSVQLAADQVQNFSLAMHELTTNAVKYGALSQPDARLAIAWSVGGEADHPRLVLEWEESGVVVTPSTRRGFGRDLIERALNYAVSDRTHYVIGAGGVRCRFELPLG